MTVKTKLLHEAFEPRFKEINAEGIFESLHRRNLSELKEKIADYDGNSDKLVLWLRSYTAAEEALAERAGVSSYFKNRDLLL